MENQQQPTQLFELKKVYHGYPSKDKVLFEGTESECLDQLNSWKYTSKKNGADITEDLKYSYTCENYGGRGETVTFEVNEL